VTAAAKKIIFLLHRVAGEGAEDAAHRAAAEAAPKLAAVQAQLAALAPDLAGPDYWRHLRVRRPSSRPCPA
jgi:hypothetical protein